MSVQYPRTSNLTERFKKIATENGYVNIANSRFLGQLMKANVKSAEAEYDKLYAIPENIDIGRARGEYLDRWGRIMGEGRRSVSYAMDLSLSNVLLSISPTRAVREITKNGGGLILKPGIDLRNSSDSLRFETIDTLMILPTNSSVYARVISAQPGEVSIPAGGLSIVRTALEDVCDNILPSMIGRYTLSVTNEKTISGGSSYADDPTYQYILQQRARSIGLLNEEKINMLMDIDGVANIIKDPYFGGMNIYLEPTTAELKDVIVATARKFLEEDIRKGAPINVYSCLTRRLKISVSIDTKTPDTYATSIDSFKSSLRYLVNTERMGSTLDLDLASKSIMNSDENITAVRINSIYYNNRTVIGSVVPQHFNEKAFIGENDITIG